ncbi:MAG TPA: hypothetical protein VHX42_00615 [Candidatus Babeliales bacterium]|jgi:hypothetical protein|nr:hypothetical protein [Candidatus Babeliales bacterium]
MKLAKLWFLLASVCFVHDGYAMDNKEQIVDDLFEARSLLIAAEYHIDDLAQLLPHSPHNKYIEIQLREAFDWTDQAYALSWDIMHNQSASKKEKKEARLLLERVYLIQKK